MKVAILGPVPKMNYCGGVAQFDLGLGSGFLSQGCEVVLLAKSVPRLKLTVFL